MNLPKHIAFIMDGNGRWGQLKKKSRNYGHLKGVKVVERIVKFSIKKRIPILTFYVFSTENWSRPKKEINYLFKLIEFYFEKELNNLLRSGVKIKILGELKVLPKNLLNILNYVQKKTINNKKIIVNLAINYGSKLEIVNTINKIIKNNNKKKITEKMLNENLYYGNQSPDILIRTGAMTRLSNFMLWQIAYTEIFFIKKLWPDFSPRDLSSILMAYKKIKRNYGSI